MHELKAGLNADKFVTFWILPKRFYHSFVLQMTFMHSTTTLEQCLLRSSSQGTLQPAKGKYPCAISKNHENLWISQTQFWTLFVISKATFTKTAIKPKFVDRFSLKEFQCCNWSVYYKIPEFRVHWKLFKLSNVGAKLSKYWSDVIDLAKFLLWDFLLPRF